MFEVWGKRRDTNKYEYICGYDDLERGKSYSILDLLDAEVYEEAIILQDKNYVLMKIYEKGKVLKK